MHHFTTDLRLKRAFTSSGFAEQDCHISVQAAARHGKLTFMAGASDANQDAHLLLTLGEDEPVAVAWAANSTDR